MSILTINASPEYLLALRDRPRNNQFVVTFNASQVHIKLGSEESSFLPIVFLASRFPSTELRQAFELCVERKCLDLAQSLGSYRSSYCGIALLCWSRMEICQNSATVMSKSKAGSR